MWPHAQLKITKYFPTFSNQTLDVQLHGAHLDELADEIVVCAACAAAILARIEVAEGRLEEIAHVGVCGGGVAYAASAAVV